MLFLGFGARRLKVRQEDDRGVIISPYRGQLMVAFTATKWRKPFSPFIRVPIVAFLRSTVCRGEITVLLIFFKKLKRNEKTAVGFNIGIVQMLIFERLARSFSSYLSQQIISAAVGSK